METKQEVVNETPFLLYIKVNFEVTIRAFASINVKYKKCIL